ncbi:MAG: SPASM domain-containing protein, partial [Lentisphaeria bacterium]|nr:SPASM domain-containing protein [Lentisphaeria bacterium]
SYRHEIAEQRAEFHNLGDPITPPVQVYERLTAGFKNKILRNIRKKAWLTRTTEAVRLVYYDVAVQILKERRQVTACYGGISNIHLNYNGDIWPCCVLGNENQMGNVRRSDYDIQALLRSPQAREARQYIAAGNCACPLANQWLNNVLLTPRHMLKVLYTVLLMIFWKAPDGPSSVRNVVPADIEVEITGHQMKQALVLDKLGTIPEEVEIELPVFKDQ